MDWFPAISTTSLLLILLWLCRNIIATRLTNAVRHEYDGKIESLKTTLRLNEESFKAELTAKESQIDALRSGALSGIVNRQAVLYDRQLKAVEQLWSAVISLSSAKFISTLMAVLKFDEAAKESARNPQFRETFKFMGGNFDINNLKTINASNARPFVSPLAWALYYAYQSIILHAVFKLKMLQLGSDKNCIATDEIIIKLVKVALPHQEEYIEKHGSGAFHYLLDELESKLLLEIDNILQGKQSDKESIERAALILKEAERLMESNASANKSE